MSQDELTQAILNVIKKEIDSASKVLPTDLLSNIDIDPEIEKLIEKSGYVSKSKYDSLNRIAQELEQRIIDLENKIKD
jgi:polyhydroxyalkanoate synthesis regulator phasin